MTWLSDCLWTSSMPIDFSALKRRSIIVIMDAWCHNTPVPARPDLQPKAEAQPELISLFWGWKLNPSLSHRYMPPISMRLRLTHNKLHNLFRATLAPTGRPGNYNENYVCACVRALNYTLWLSFNMPMNCPQSIPWQSNVFYTQHSKALSQSGKPSCKLAIWLAGFQQALLRMNILIQAKKKDSNSII